MKYIICLLLSLITFSGVLYGQTKMTVRTKEGLKVLTSDTSEACNKGPIYFIVESKPTYKGGFKALETDLNTHI